MTNTRGTIPHSIAQAIQAFQFRRRNDESIVHFDYPIDLLAVVTSVEENSPGNISKRFVRLWIHDASVSQAKSAQMLVFGKRRCNDLVQITRIVPGDVVRFNRIMLLPNVNAQETYATFSFDIHNPEVGCELYRFGNVKDSNMLLYDSNYQNIDEIPLSMQTNPKCIKDLTVWCQSSFNLISSTTNVIAAGDNNLGHVLEALPCQHRTLLEFQSCIGIVGHTTVNVVQVEIVNLSPHKKKRRYTNKQQSHESTTKLSMFVTLTDDSNTFATFIIDSGTDQYIKLRNTLSIAQKSNRPVVLSNITSKSMNQNLRNYYGSSIPDSTDGVLLPTNTTDVTLIDNPINDRQNNNSQQFSLTQISLPTERIELLEIRSAIIDIVVNNVSLKKSYLDQNDTSSINQVLSMLKQSPIEDIRDDYSVSAYVQVVDDHDTIINVQVNDNVLLYLSGSGRDLSGGDDTGTIQDTSCRRSSLVIPPTNMPPKDMSSGDVYAKYQQLMIIILHSLVTEDIELKWVIEKRNSESDVNNSSITYNARHVTLLEF
jgi:hypothetical protein